MTRTQIIIYVAVGLIVAIIAGFLIPGFGGDKPVDGGGTTDTNVSIQIPTDTSDPTETTDDPSITPPVVTDPTDDETDTDETDTTKPPKEGDPKVETGTEEDVKDKTPTVDTSKDKGKVVSGEKDKNTVETGPASGEDRNDEIIKEKEEKTPAKEEEKDKPVIVAGGKKRLPDNKELGLEKRKVGTEDRAWTVEEVKAGMEVAKNMGRIDAYHAIGIGYAFGLRVEEICRVRLEDVEKALTNDGLRVKGKGGQIRIVPVEVEVQKDLLKYLYNYARNNHLLPRDYIISRNEKGGVERQIDSLENWMYTNRHKFTMKNRQDEVRDGKKPRSKDLTWHGLRYKRAQEQYAMYEAEGRKNPKLMTSEILGHHRTDITNVYLAELPQGKKNQE